MLGLNFTSNKISMPIREIIVQSPKKFEQTIKPFIKSEVSPFPRYKLKYSVTSPDSKYTMNANTCTILGMSNGKDTFLGHFAPELEDPNFADRLDYIIKKLQDATGELSAIIAGGHDYNLDNIVYQSKKSYDKLAEVGGLLDKNSV